MTRELAEKMLSRAREALGAHKIEEGMTLIIQVADTAPQFMDPTLLATVPLYRSIVLNLSKLRNKFESDWDSDRNQSGAA